ncbi:efflux RND transporter periplasmic adaptor subunit [Herbiconiux daphne]|uniref:Efflux RND transporter periplasmic adaptor subunit n=1 Tax=Herbiconiux daphne TaxID=2970914 RepID=A0ABT2H428_9MICO|nr:efflux RND transporter periplasmic adaptor subunit [Herbiconiux daphne]MCS5734694.1 efflux RND transporter periplasmic adaptor subunit [Herbiconiux daphne]
MPKNPPRNPAAADPAAADPANGTERHTPPASSRRAAPTAPGAVAASGASGASGASATTTTSARPVLSAKRAAAKRRRTRRALAIGITTVVLCAFGGGAVFALSQQSGNAYRTAVAALGTVDETLALSGTVASATRRDTAFQAGGTVNGVSVAVGDTVTAGQQLATIDTSDLQDAIDTAQDAVTTAEDQLESDLEAQSSTDTSTTGTDTGSGTTAGTPDAAGTGAGAGSGAASGTGTGAGIGSGAGTGTGSGTGPDSGDGSGTGTGGGSGDGTGTGTGDGTGVDTVALQAAVAAVTSAQQALLAQYSVASDALAATQQTIATSDTTCQPFLEATLDDLAAGAGDGTSGTGSGTDGTDPASTDPSSSDPTSSGSGTSADGSTAADGNALLDTIKADLAACQGAITQVQTEQTTANDAQTTVLSLMDQLDSAVATLQSVLITSTPAEPSSDAPTTDDPTPAPTSDRSATPTTDSDSAVPTAAVRTAAVRNAAATGAPLFALASSVTQPASATTAVDDPTGGTGSTTTGTSGTGTTGTGSTTASTTITAETIVADQAQIDLAQANLAIARQQLTLATLTSPIAGTVAAVALSVGDTVSAASATAVITVIGDDGFVVDTTVTLADVAKLAVGQAAAITLASTDTALTGVVSAIGVLDVSTDSSTPTYDVTVAIDPADAALLNGASAQVEVAVASQQSVLTVPTSAVHRSGTDYTVDVLSNGDSTATPVEVGAMGAERTEVTSGLAEGDVVVLADLNADVPGTDDTTGTGTGSGLTGLGGSGTTVTVPGGFGGGSAPSFQGGPPAR